MSYQDAKDLLIKYKNDECTDAEKAIVEQWLFEYGKNEIDLSDNTIDSVELQVWANVKPRQTKVRALFTWGRAAAAAILLVACIGGFILLHKSTPQTVLAQDVAPGSNKAILTLANGSKIILANAKTGVLANQQNVAINKTANGDVIYSAADAAKTSAEVSYNTITTPRGGRYDLTLSDGTKVSLDAASSITYPVAFNGDERKVAITGQVYFEVVHRVSQPFRVAVKNQVIEDMGTHFNVNAYDDEPQVTTTLLEGAIKLQSGKAGVILKPGQQAGLQANGSQYDVTAADITSAIAWKNGLFSFDHTSLKPLLRQIARWYDVEVEYNSSVDSFDFVGGIKRNTNLSNVLKILQQSGVHFKIEGKKLIVE